MANLIKNELILRFYLFVELKNKKVIVFCFVAFFYIHPVKVLICELSGEFLFNTIVTHICFLNIDCFPGRSYLQFVHILKAEIYLACTLNKSLVV